MGLRFPLRISSSLQILFPTPPPFAHAFKAELQLDQSHECTYVYSTYCFKQCVTFTS